MKTVMEELIGEIKTLTDWGLVKGAFDNGLTYLCTSGDTEGRLAVFIDKKEYVANGHGLVDEYDSGKKTSVCTSGEVELKLISISSSDNNPVFTQAMADNGELPKAGMLCLINFPDIDNAWYEYTIDFIGKHMVVATCKEVAERTGHIDNVYFKPIDTRTNKEKAIDEISLTLDGMSKNNSNQETAEVLMHFILENKFHDVKWMGE